MKDRMTLFTCWRYAISSFCETWLSTAQMYTRFDRIFNKSRPAGYGVAPWYVIIVNMVVVAPMFAFEQAYAGYFAFERGWPWWPVHLNYRIWMAVDTWVEARATWYSYLPPDSGLPSEIGFHYRSDLLPRDEDGHIDQQKRPRIFNYSYPGPVSTG